MDKSSKKSVLITTNSFYSFQAIGIDKIESKYGLKMKHSNDIFKNDNIETQINYLNQFEGIIAGTEKYDNKLLSKLHNIKVISRVGVGLDSIDIKSANKNNIAIENTPTAHVDSVAQFNVAVYYLLKSNIINYSNQMRNKIWKKSFHDLAVYDKIGFYGLGKVSLKTINLLNIDKLNVVYFDPYVNNLKYKKVNSLEKLFAGSDTIFINAPLNEQTKNSVNDKVLKSLKNGSKIICCSRGGIINESSLVNYLTFNNKSSCFLDVFKNEPYVGELLNLENLYASPHVAGYSRSSRLLMEEEAILNCLKHI